MTSGIQFLSLVPSDRTDIAYAITDPTGTIMKIVLINVMLATMR